MNSTKQPTIYDIASEANVSISTVSRVFNNSAVVNDKTRKKVEEAIQKLNYIPNAIARSLANNLSYTIGLIVSDLSNPFFTDVIDGIEHVISQEGYFAFNCDTRYDLAREKKYISRMLQKRVDGIITFSTNERAYDLIRSAEKQVPVVSVQSLFRDTDSVNTHDTKGAYIAVEHLIKLGHKHIGFIVFDYENLTIESRTNGYKFAHLKNDLPFNKDYIVKSQFCADVGFKATKELLNKHPEITAIFAYNDKLAIASYAAIRDKGLRIPEDISVIGYDDTDNASIVHPKLTTISQPKYEIGVKAAELLLQRIKEKDHKALPKLIMLEENLIVRESTRALK